MWSSPHWQSSPGCLKHPSHPWCSDRLLRADNLLCPFFLIVVRKYCTFSGTCASGWGREGKGDNLSLITWTRWATNQSMVMWIVTVFNRCTPQFLRIHSIVRHIFVVDVTEILSIQLFLHQTPVSVIRNSLPLSVTSVRYSSSHLFFLTAFWFVIFSPFFSTSPSLVCVSTSRAVS